MTKTVTFMSDFGLRDPYVGEVKGVINACDPGIQIIDITHWIEPGNLIAASFILVNSFVYFRRGTLHLAVIDPGVGSTRDILSVFTKEHVFIGPDNGILYESVKRAGGGRIFALDHERFFNKIAWVYRGNEVIEKILDSGASETFHGRDIFAPLTAYICEGRKIEDIAHEKDSMLELEITFPVRQKDKIIGKVVYIDRFGNLVTNVSSGLVSSGDEVFLKTGTSMSSVGRMQRSYSSVEEKNPLALIGSRGFLEIAVNRGNAREYFDARGGDEILILKQAEEE